MISIQKRLRACLLGGLGIVWLAVCAAVHVTVRASLEGKFDAELSAIASEVRYVLPESRPAQAPKPSAFWLDFFKTKSGLYFEVWDDDLLFSERSPNLGQATLPRPPAFTEEPHIWNFVLTSGEKVRGIAQQFFLIRGRRINVVVARNRDALDGSRRLLLIATGGVGLLIIPITLLTVRVAVVRGLKPLRDFGERVATFGVDALSERFGPEGIPDELLPISGRLNELMDRLEAGIDRERRLNADLAHELRTPVAELKTMAEVALTWPDQISGDHYREVLGAAQQMQSVIDGMLLLARCDRGIESPTKELVDVAGLLKTCWQPHAATALKKRLQVEETIPKELALQSNPGLLQIILGNLIANAVEYCPEGGLLSIQGGHAAGRFSLTVTNSVGDMRREDIPHLFERFWRRDTARSGRGHAGLGLAIAKACAEALSINLSVELVPSPSRISFLVAASSEGACPSDVNKLL